jgi:hypothetical protein
MECRGLGQRRQDRTDANLQQFAIAAQDRIRNLENRTDATGCRSLDPLERKDRFGK